MADQLKLHLRATAHIYVIAAIVAAALYLVAGCQATGHGLARLGGAGGGAAVGAMVGGPIGAGVGAIAGDAGANLVVPPPAPPPATVNNIDARNGGVAYVGHDLVEYPWYEPWLFWGKVAIAVLGLLVAIPRTRPHVLGFLYSVVLGHGKSALAKAGAAIGVVHSATADATLAAARRRRGAKPPPAVVVSTEQKEHA